MHTVQVWIGALGIFVKEVGRNANRTFWDLPIARPDLFYFILRYQQFEETEYHGITRQHLGHRAAPSTKLSAAIPVITD